LREVVCPVLKLREEKWTFVIVGGGKIDFFLFCSVASAVDDTITMWLGTAGIEGGTARSRRSIRVW
jgi:hypothetical protein